MPKNKKKKSAAAKNSSDLQHDDNTGWNTVTDPKKEHYLKRKQVKKEMEELRSKVYEANLRDYNTRFGNLSDSEAEMFNDKNDDESANDLISQNVSKKKKKVKTKKIHPYLRDMKTLRKAIMDILINLGATEPIVCSTLVQQLQVRGDISWKTLKPYYGPFQQFLRKNMENELVVEGKAFFVCFIIQE